MLTTLNNFIKYSSIIRTSIQILYNFRIHEALDLLRIENIDIIKTKTVMITVYPVIIRSATVETSSVIKNPSIIRRRITSLKVIISIKSSIVTFYAKDLISITSIETTFSAKETSFIETSRIAIMNEYRPSHIDIKNVIAFTSLKMKKIYDIRH